jgi:hypothetical protein
MFLSLSFFITCMNGAGKQGKQAHQQLQQR